MDFLINSALAQAEGAPAQGGLVPNLLLMVLIFGVFYFLVIRPQSKRAKEHEALVAGLAEGDEVVTNGGLLGRVTEVGEQILTVEIANGVKVQVQRHMVGAVMPKGTVKISGDS